MALKFLSILILSAILSITGCEASPNTFADAPSEKASTTSESTASAAEDSEKEERKLLLWVNGEQLSVIWEDNASTAALCALAAQGTITIHTENYGGFEQVGDLPQSIVSNDVQKTTEPGDIVLYSGNTLVLFYGSNTWAYTKLGHIDGFSPHAYKNLLGGDKATVTLSLSGQ